MISYLRGKVAAVADKHLILEVNGIGYRVLLGEKRKNSIPKIGTVCKLFTYTNVNSHEGALELYGFFQPEELEFFEQLLTVSGIGPKNAQAIAGIGELPKIRTAIAQGNEAYLCQFGGVGIKTAKRLIVELRERMQKTLTTEREGDLTGEMQAVEALMALGYHRHEAQRAVGNVTVSIISLEERVKEALKLLGQGH